MNDISNNNIRPFEWLTSPASLNGLIEEHVLMPRKTKLENLKGREDGNGISQKQGGRMVHAPLPLQALHVGCGSSIVGEHLVQYLGFDKVVNVDCDRETMQRMEKRWKSVVEKTDCKDTTDEDDSSPERMLPCKGQMEFFTLDFTRQSLPDPYIDSFDLVLDKSTLDCTLCSDSATASLLLEVYRTLKTNGGVYIVISFHEMELLLPLLQDLPGARWTVEHTTMDRQIEKICTSIGIIQAVTGPNASENEATIISPSEDKKPLNVIIAKRYSENDDDCKNDHTFLNFDEVYQHVHEVNDRWFQEEHPLLTDERLHDLQRSFGVASGDADDSAKRKELSLEEAFGVIFTAAEREHLTYEHFLEDWEAFQCRRTSGDDVKTSSTSHIHPEGICMTYDMAVQFLKEMQ